MAYGSGASETASCPLGKLSATLRRGLYACRPSRGDDGARPLCDGGRTWHPSTDSERERDRNDLSWRTSGRSDSCLLFLSATQSRQRRRCAGHIDRSTTRGPTKWDKKSSDTSSIGRARSSFRFW